MNAVGQAASNLPKYEIEAIDQRTVRTLRSKELNAAKKSASNKRITAIEKIKHERRNERTAILIGKQKEELLKTNAISPLRARGIQKEHMVAKASARQKASRKQKNNDPNLISKMVQEREKLEFEKWRKMEKHRESHVPE